MVSEWSMLEYANSAQVISKCTCGKMLPIFELDVTCSTEVLMGRKKELFIFTSLFSPYCLVNELVENKMAKG